MNIVMDWWLLFCKRKYGLYSQTY